MEIWPTVLVTGLSFAIPQFLVSNYIGPKLMDIIAARAWHFPRKSHCQKLTGAFLPIAWCGRLSIKELFTPVRSAQTNNFFLKNRA